MPGRRFPLVKNEFYHLLNRGIASQLTFTNAWHYRRMLNLLQYYRYKEVPCRFSSFTEMSENDKNKVLMDLELNSTKFVELYSFCLMPTHFHFLVKQTSEEGISKFMSKLTNSYTRYFNNRANRKGPLFQGKFKSVRVMTEEQLLHVHRYIHLNPYSSYVIKNINELENYEFSSLPEYLNTSSSNLCETKLILGYFKDIDTYKKFHFDRADYQRRLENIKHLLLE